MIVSSNSPIYSQLSDYNFVDQTAAVYVPITSKKIALVMVEVKIALVTNNEVTLKSIVIT